MILRAQSANMAAASLVGFGIWRLKNLTLWIDMELDLMNEKEAIVSSEMRGNVNVQGKNS